MTHNRFVAAVAAVFGFAIVTLTGCGGGNNGGGGGNTQPSITSFSSSPAIVTDGATAKLTAVFSNGTGMVTPGNVSVTSGTAVSITPPNDATTTYTLTVTGTGSSGSVTSTTTAQAVAAPAITAFTAGTATINAGGSTTLIATFTGGTGLVTPGNLSITSGTALTVSPSSTTTYTITVTNAASTAVTQTVTVTVIPQPAITSFVSNHAAVTDGATASLTAVFTGGTGVITPGNISVTSGVGASVTPPSDATTTYTLTVTGASGTTPATATANVQAVAAPSIISFAASPASISSGDSSDLTGVFTGGTGVITPGNLTATSATAVSVSPTATTTYTLTVTNAANTAVTKTAMVTVAAAASATITVDPSTPGIAVTDQILGFNLAAWYVSPTNATSINTAFNQAGIKAIRWPGGSWSDGYHWGYQTGSSALVAPYNCTCSSPTSCTANNTSAWAGNQTFAQFTSLIPEAGPFDLALTANYGTNESCSAGGDPKEAAAWAAAAVTDGITPSHMTVGNEEYGSWETDLHAKANDPTTYAAAVIGSSGYYSLIKAASPNTKVGVVVDANANNGCCAAGWDTTVLTNAAGSYDFVEFHYYPQNPGGESDSYLVNQAAKDFTTNINTIKSELQTAGKPDTPIYVGEMGSVSSNPGKQSMSITQGLFAGQMLGEMMNDGVIRATWWIGFGNCNGTAGNDSSSLYGWQDYGAYNVFSDGPTVDPTCPDSGPDGTMNPTAQAYNLFQKVAVDGEHVLTPSVTGDTTDVQAYAATATHIDGTGLALVLFNLNKTSSETVQVTVTGEGASSDVQVITYDKGLYDQTNAATPVWASPTTNDMGTQTLPMTLTLTPWSMNVVLIK
jgi:hypothetical protein